MNETILYLASVYLAATLLIATMTDVYTHRIPNVLLALSLFLASVFGTAVGGFAGLLATLAGACVGLTMLVPLYVVGGIAAGDVKLLAVVGAYLGPAGAFFAGLFTFVAGAVMGLAWICWRRRQERTGGAPIVQGDAQGERLVMSEPGSTIDSRLLPNQMPYAPSILVGSVSSAWYLDWALLGV